MSRIWNPRFLLIILTLITLRVNSQCEVKFTRRNKVFEFDLASSIRNFPHGVLSEDGFYKVEANSTVLWFQLCDVLIFNHDPPRCVGCEDCGGLSRCGTSCSALVSENYRGYDVCTSLGHASSSKVDLIDKENPGKGVIIKMSRGSGNENCSLSVSVICQKNKVDGPLTMVKSDNCQYATELRHPSGCAVAISGHVSCAYLELIYWVDQHIGITLLVFVAQMLSQMSISGPRYLSKYRAVLVRYFTDSEALLLLVNNNPHILG